MTRPTRYEQVLADLMDDGPEVAPSELLGSVLTTLSTRHARRRFGAVRRFNVLSMPVRATAAAAAVVVLVATGLTLAGALDFPRTGPAGATASPVTSLTPSVAPAPTSRVAGATQIGSGATMSAGTTYTTALFSPAVSFAGQSSWWVRQDATTQLAIWRNQADIGQGLVDIVQPGQVLEVGGTAAPAPADLVVWLQARSDLALGAPVPVTVDGLHGTELEGTVRSGALLNSGGAINLACPVGIGACRFEGEAELGVGGTDHFYLVVLNVRGTALLMVMTANPSVWQAAGPQFQAFLSSLAFPAGGG